MRTRLLRAGNLTGRAALFVVAFAAMGPGAAFADAAQRYASPTGSGDCSSPVQACSLITAVSLAGANDEVIVGAGTYALGGTTLNPAQNGIDVHGAAGGPKPVIQSSANPGINISGANAKLSDLRIEHTASGAQSALFASGSVTMSRLEVISQGAACTLVGVGPVIRDSLCLGGSDPFEAGLSFYAGVDTSASARNVTATGTHGVYAGTSAAGTISVTVNLRNVIASGQTSDITTFNVSATNSTTVTATYSNYDTLSPAGTGTTSITPAGSATNQAAAPIFVNAAGADYRQATGSPTIDAGATDSLTGTSDVAGVARPQGSAIDIGAYENPVGAPPQPDTTPPETTIDKGPKKKSKSKKAKFKFSSSEAGSTFTCALDKTVAKPCASPVKLKGLKKGKHKLTVVATDPAGNKDATPAVYKWKVKKKPKK